MQELRQSTAINVKIGPAVNSTGVTPVTGLTIDAADEAEILKANTTATLAISGTLSAIANCDGWYNMSLTAGDTDELGPLTVVIQDDSAILPIFRDYMVVDQTYFDAKYNTTGAVKCDIRQIGGSATTALTDFKASVTGYSTFDPATTGVTLASATYDTASSFHASVTGYSTFDPTASEVSISADSVDAVLDDVVEGTITLRQATRLFLSVLTGKVSGGSTTTLTFRDIGDTKNRLVVTVDANKNRTAVGTRDGT